MTTYITLKQAKDHLAVDDATTYWDERITDLIGAGIDWAENYTQRSLSELLVLDSPADSPTKAAPDPKDSPPVEYFPDGYDWSVTRAAWGENQFRAYWAANTALYPVNPVQVDHAAPLRRDVRQAILLYIETLFDRNPDNFALLEARAESMLNPYRIAMGV